MEQYKQDFIEFMVQCGVLKFGDFTTKSGRKTPFFINTGNYRTGLQIHRLGGFYAAAIHKKLGTRFNVLYGPAYKGIPLAVTTDTTSLSASTARRQKIMAKEESLSGIHRQTAIAWLL
jgi:orotate phosphoribosyltransferase